jgi:hypothetical protein
MDHKAQAKNKEKSITPRLLKAIRREVERAIG